MKNFILNALKGYQELTSEEIMNLADEDFKNSEFKLNLAKDKTKGAKVSEEKFYVKNRDVVVKFCCDEACGRLAVYPSDDIQGLPIKELDALEVEKIEFYCNESFDKLQKDLKTNGYEQEVVRADRFLNGVYEDEIILSKLREKI